MTGSDVERRDNVCVNCGHHPIERINYALGPVWMHYTEGSSSMSGAFGPWEHCRVGVATPPEGAGRG